MAVILYSTGCPKCKILKQKLDDKKIDYTINSSVQEMLDMGLTQVPVLSVDGKMYPFNEAVLFVQSMKRMA